jgi:hypothetical protein
VAPADERLFSGQTFAIGQANADAIAGLLDRSWAACDYACSGGPGDGRAWLQIASTSLSAGATHAGPGFHDQINGVDGGGDAAIGPVARIGLALGYDRESLRDGLGGTGLADVFRISAYSSQTWARLTLSEALGYGRAWSTTSRATGIGSASGGFTTDEITGAVQVAAPTSLGTLSVTPAAGVQVSWLGSSAFAERQPQAAFAVSGSGDGATFASPYVRVGFARSFTRADGLVITPDASIGYRYDAIGAGESFTLTASDGTLFHGAREALGGGSGLLDLRVSAHKVGWSAYVSYRLQASDHWTEQSGELGLRFAF